MIVTGLNGNRILSGNEIPVTISLDDGSDFDTGSYISISITRLVTHSGDEEVVLPSIKLYPLGSDLKIDLSPYIKGLMPYAYAPSNTYINPTPNYQNISINFYESQTDSSQSFLNKTFIRGFKREYSDLAFTMPIGSTLSPVDLIPVWSGYPTSRTYIDTDGTIKTEEIVNSSLTKQMKLPSSCNPFYIRFLNSTGGYSHWMFNSWDWNTTSKDSGIIKKVGEDISLGFTEENTVTADTRVNRMFFPLMRDLISSPVVQAYNKFGNTWKLIHLKPTKFTENSYEDLIEFTCSFDLNLKNNPQVVW